MSSFPVSILLLLIVISENLYAFNKITVVTELFSPFQVLDENKVLSGWSTTTVNKILQQTKLDYKINVLPWARAYKVVTNQPNTLIFSLLRTLDREDNFNWLVPLCTLKVSFYKMGGNKQVIINSLADVKAYKIGVERAQVKKDFLIAKGLTKNTVEVNSNIQLREMLKHDRIDMIIASKSFFDDYNKHQADLSLQLEAVFPINVLIDKIIISAYQANVELPPQCFLAVK